MQSPKEKKQFVALPRKKFVSRANIRPYTGQGAWRLPPAIRTANATGPTAPSAAGGSWTRSPGDAPSLASGPPRPQLRFQPTRRIKLRCFVFVATQFRIQIQKIHFRINVSRSPQVFYSSENFSIFLLIIRSPHYSLDRAGTKIFLQTRFVLWRSFLIHFSWVK